MTDNRAGRYQERAIRHEARARNYRRQADLLLQRDSDADCAGALLYEAAKQCINALANQRGSNPGSIGGKVSVLRAIAAEAPDGLYLLRNWQSADKLHVHADRGHLAEADFIDHWHDAHAFISAMLAIYNRNV